MPMNCVVEEGHQGRSRGAAWPGRGATWVERARGGALRLGLGLVRSGRGRCHLGRARRSAMASIEGVEEDYGRAEKRSQGVSCITSGLDG